MKGNKIDFFILKISKVLNVLSQSFLLFWLYQPALLYGIAFLLGIFCHLAPPSGWIWPCLCLWFPFACAILYLKQQEFIKPFILSLLTFFTAWTYASAHYTFPSLPSEGLTGKAHIKIKNMSLQSNLFGERWFYRCEIVQFFPEDATHSIVNALPCLIILRKGSQLKSPPPANQEYWVSGKLLQTAKGSYLFKVSSKTPWMPIEGTWSLAEQRYAWKKGVAQWIESQFSYALSGSFLAGLVTGEFDDHWMRQQFSRFGLQHLLAISGFHFAMIAGCLCFALRLFLTRNACLISLLFCLGTYCFFLGPQASILRAWIMCSLTLIGGLLEKQTTALNSLGLALLLILGYQPLLCQELGFQLSFATTASILLFYSPAQVWLYSLFPKRNLSEVLQMNGWNQHAYCILAFLRQGLALTLAVNVFALPLTLYYFQQFPWMSLLYNLFFPFLVSGSLCLLLLGTFCSFIPLLADAIHQLNNHYTFFLLQLTYQVPLEMDNYLKIDSFHPLGLIIYLCLVSLGGIVWKGMSEQHDLSEYFRFI